MNFEGSRVLCPIEPRDWQRAVWARVMANLKNGMNSPPSFVPQHDKTRTDNPKPSQTFQVPLGQVAVAGTWKNNNFTKLHQISPRSTGSTGSNINTWISGANDPWRGSFGLWFHHHLHISLGSTHKAHSLGTMISAAVPIRASLASRLETTCF